MDSPSSPPAIPSDSQVMGNPPAPNNSKPEISKLAVSALILSILGWPLFFPAIAAVISGHIALKQIRKPTSPLMGRGLAIAGLSIAYPAIFIWMGFITLLLLGHMLSAPKDILDRAKLAQTKNMSLQLVSAISTYYTEYRTYPISGQQSENLDLLSDQKLMNVLLGSDKSSGTDSLNPRGITFFSGKKAKPMGKGKYRGGLSIDSDGNSKLWDPWGNHFRVRIDLDGNNKVNDPFEKSAHPKEIPVSIIVWSAGKDGIDGTADDIKSWQ